MQGKPAPSRYAERKGFIIVHCNVAISHCYDGCEMDIPCMSKIKVSRLGYPTEAWLRAANQPGFFETMWACFYGDLASYFSPCLPMRLKDHVLGSHFIDKISRPVTRLSNIGPATCSMPGHRLQDGEVWFVQQSVFSSGIPMLPLLFEQVMSSASASYAD